MFFIDLRPMTRRRFKKILSFGEVLKKYRTEGGMSQVTLARKTKMSPSLLAFMEQNRRSPRRDKILAISQALSLVKKKSRNGCWVPQDLRGMGCIRDRRFWKNYP